MLQAGIVDYLEHRDLPSTKICPLDLQSKDRQLLNSDLYMTYMIMVTGLSAAVAVFIGEVFTFVNGSQQTTLQLIQAYL